MFYQTHTASKPLKVPVTMHCCHPFVATEWSHLQHTAHALQRIINGDDAAVFPVLSLVTLVYDLDIQTRLSKGPNTSSM